MTKPETKQYFSFNGLVRSFRYAGEGIWFCLKTQRNAFVHVMAAIAVCTLAVIVDLSASDWRWIVACIMLVWFAELMNTAFEYLCDLINPDFHASVKRAKDIAAGAVLICSAGAVIIGVISFLPYFLQ